MNVVKTRIRDNGYYFSLNTQNVFENLSSENSEDVRGIFLPRLFYHRDEVRQGSSYCCQGNQDAPPYVDLHVTEETSYPTMPYLFSTICLLLFFICLA